MGIKILNKVSKSLLLSQIVALLSDSNFMMKNALINEISNQKLKIQGNVLDFGCGSKPYEKFFKHCTSYIGVDVEISGHNHLNSSVDIYYDGKFLPWPDSHFDSIVSFEVFEHLSNPVETVREIHRVLKSEGTLLITVPFVYGEHEIPFDFQRWTSYGIRKFFEESAFLDIEIIKLNKSPAFALQLFVNIFMNKISYSNKRLLKIIFVPINLFINLILIFLKFVLPKTPWFFSNMLIIAKK